MGKVNGHGLGSRSRPALVRRRFAGGGRRFRRSRAAVSASVARCFRCGGFALRAARAITAAMAAFFAAAASASLSVGCSDRGFGPAAAFAAAPSPAAAAAAASAAFFAACAAAAFASFFGLRSFRARRAPSSIQAGLRRVGGILPSRSRAQISLLAKREHCTSGIRDGRRNCSSRI